MRINKNLKYKIAITLKTLLSIMLFVFVTLTQFVRKYDTVTGTVYDGIGRLVTYPPEFVRIFFDMDFRLPSVGWLIFDSLLFLLVMYVLFKDMDRS